MNDESSRPQVITFYSYKGGTGRTMALANVGCLLASESFVTGDILMIDWDLEAPGLHRFFGDHIFPNVHAPEDKERQLLAAPGLIELFHEIEIHLSLTPSVPEDAESPHQEGVIESLIDRHVIPTDIPKLFLMKAGRFDEGYSERINRFRWEGLFEKAPWIFSLFARTLTKRFQYVLIDSRTGHTDTSGICTMMLPEKLVVVFTPNRQSLTGAVDLARMATTYRRRSDDLRPLSVFPLASRVELAEPRLKELWRTGVSTAGVKGYQPLFETLFREVYDLPECNLGGYFDEVQIQQIPRYAYGEAIAVLEEKEDDRLSLTRSYRSFTRRLVGLSNPWERSTNLDQGEPYERKTEVRRRVGRYDIVRRIGRGAMGWSVFEAIDPVLARPVAIKTISKASDETSKERLYREAKSVAALHHPNIVTIFDLVEDQETTFMVMELLEGRTLQQVISNRDVLSLHFKLDVMVQICVGVAHAHQRGIVHGDLKPGNLFLTKEGVVKVMDFALSKPEASRETQEGLVAGTPSYMSPEQVEGKAIDVRSDVFSLGATFYEFLAYRRAFEGETIPTVLFKIIQSEPEHLGSVVPGFPTQIANVVHRCLAKKPEERYPSVNNLIIDIRQCQATA